MISSLPDSDIEFMAEHWAMAVWQGKVVDGMTGQAAFERDAAAYAGGVEFEDDEDPNQELFRCHDCKSLDVQVARWVDMNTGRAQGDESKSVLGWYYCQVCHDRRGMGEVKYIEHYDPKTGEWGVL